MEAYGADDSLVVFGGSGFLGAHVVARARVGRVVSVSRASKVPDAVRPGAKSTELTERYVDLAEPGSARALLDGLRPTHAILLTALSRVEDCERDPALAERLNVDLPGEIAKACHELDIRLVSASTDLVFDGEPPRASGYVEGDERRPKHAYGRTKAAGEDSVLEHDASAVVVRLPLLFGDSFGRGAGASDSLAFALEGGASPTLFADEWRTPIDARIAAEALHELARSDVRGVLHVGGADRIDRFELGSLLLRRAQLEDSASRLVRGRRADLGMEARPRDVSLDSSRARALLATELSGVREWARGRA